MRGSKRDEGKEVTSGQRQRCWFPAHPECQYGVERGRIQAGLEEVGLGRRDTSLAEVGPARRLVPWSYRPAVPRMSPVVCQLKSGSTWKL